MNGAIVAGHACLDLIPSIGKTGSEISELFVPGKIINCGSCCISPGGPVSNTGIALARLGVDTTLVCKTGNDEFGKIYAEKLCESGVKSKLSVSKSGDTAYTVVISVPGFDRIFVHNPGVNADFCSDDIVFSDTENSSLFHFGYPPLMKRICQNGGADLKKIFCDAKSHGLTTSLDMSLPDEKSDAGSLDWQALLSCVLKYVDIFIPSYEETLFMLDRKGYNEFRRITASQKDPLENLNPDACVALGDKMLEMGAKIAVIKCGVRGYYVRTAKSLDALGRAKPGNIDNWSGRELFCPSFFVKNIASATGSGDSSIAGFLSAFMHGLSLEEAMEIACAAGAKNLEFFDALSGIKNWDDVCARAKSTDRNSLNYTGTYFHALENTSLLIGKNDRAL